MTGDLHIGIIMNGVTGRMGTNQHLIRSVAAIRERTVASIGIPWSAAILANASLWRSGVKPFSTYSSGERASTTIRRPHGRS